MSDVVTIDGSQGEGGGQMIRSSLALSIVTGRPVHITNIRAGRKKPGLMRQHLTCVQAARAICGGKTNEVGIGADELTFEPSNVVGGDYRFSIGSAGSCLLVLQTVLPPLMLAAQPSRVSLEGGTHNPWAPPFDFLQRVFVPLLRKMGPTLELELERHGFYPGGGGSVVTSITPASELRGMKLMERGRVHTKRVRAMVSNLPIDIANREVSVIQRLSGWPAKCFEAYSVKAHGPGNIVLLETQCDRLSEMFVGFGREGVRAEKVARALWKEFREFDEADVPVGPHLADQILLPIGLANWQDSANTSRFRTVEPTQHTLTHIDILQRFLGVEIQVKDEDGTYVVSCS